MVLNYTKSNARLSRDRRVSKKEADILRGRTENPARPVRRGFGKREIQRQLLVKKSGSYFISTTR